MNDSSHGDPDEFPSAEQTMEFVSMKSTLIDKAFIMLERLVPPPHSFGITVPKRRVFTLSGYVVLGRSVFLSTVSLLASAWCA